MKPLHAPTLPLQGRHLVEASAGTGKTWTIATLFVRLVVERGTPVDRILVVTYTRAATAELRDRLRRRLREALDHLDGAPTDDAILAEIVAAWKDVPVARDRLASALRDFDLAPVLTIHSFCQRALRENAFESGAAFDVELIEDDQAFVSAAAQDLWTDLLWQAERPFVEWLHTQIDWTRVLDLVRTGLRAAPPRLLPSEDVPSHDFAERLEAVRQAHRALREAWEGDGEPLGRAVATCPALSRGSYGDRHVEPRVGRLRRALQGGRISLSDKAFFDDVAYFTTERMARALKQKTSVDDLPQRPEIPACEALLAARDAALAGASDRFVALCRALVERAPEAMARVKRARGEGRFFDDLIGQLAGALRDPHAGPALARALRARFPVALIDEFQDTDPVQWEVFRAMHPRGTDGALFLIGDPKQAIYAFRGADLHAYLAAAREVGAEGAWGLEVNHRSDGPLVEAVNALFSRPKDPFGQAGVDYPAVRARHVAPRLRRAGRPVAPLQVVVQEAVEGYRGKTTHHKEIPARVASEIVALLDGDVTIGDRSLRPADIAVLVRSNRNAGLVQDALRARGVPSVRHGSLSVLASEEARELLALMEALTRPNDLRAVRGALVTPLLGATADELHRLEGDEGALQAVLQEVRGWRETWESRGFMRMFQRLCAERGALARLLGIDGGDRRVTNLRHVAELVHGEEQARGLRPLGAVSWLVREVQRASAEEGGAAEMRLESDAAAVQIVTMHKSKGLEYPVVFCPYLWTSPFDEPFPSWHDGQGKVLQLRPDDDPEGVARRLAESRSEDLRLAYVALTRARHLCVVHWGAISWNVGGNAQAFELSPLAHLLHPPDGPPGANAAEVGVLDDQGLFAAASAWAAGTEGRVEVRWSPEPSPRRWRPPPEEVAVREPSRPGPRPRAASRVASFSSLVRSVHEATPEPAAARDVDALPLVPVDPEPRAPHPLVGFPAGARPGSAWHAVMEHLDFAAVREADDVVPLAREQLAAHGLDPELAPLVAEATVAFLATPLGQAPALGRVSRSDRIDELEFAMGVGEAQALDATRLAAAFREVLPDRLAEPVAARLERLDFVPVAGVVKGFVDLLFRHEGRWWIVDYKTNDLGPSPGDYDGPGLDRAMIEGDYVLQYHLYALALRRHLRRRVAGFDWDRDLGGVLYLFVRGMRPETADARGVFFDRPDAARLDRLDAALRGEAS